MRLIGIICGVKLYIEDDVPEEDMNQMLGILTKALLDDAQWGRTAGEKEKAK